MQAGDAELRGDTETADSNVKTAFKFNVAAIFVGIIVLFVTIFYAAILCVSYCH